jgi:hypothetical protein
LDTLLAVFTFPAKKVMTEVVPKSFRPAAENTRNRFYWSMATGKRPVF